MKNSSLFESESEIVFQQKIIDAAQLYEIDFFTLYPGYIMAEYLSIMEEEAFNGIAEAYQDGYKQCVLEFAPENERLLYENVLLRKNKKNDLKVRFFCISTAGIIGIILGFICSFVL